MNIEKLKEWSYDNWQIILVVLITLLVGISAYNYNAEESWKCKEFELIDKFEKSEVSNEYIIYYSDGRIEESYSIPRCIKINKQQ